jgi:hypothetical protein
MICDFSAKRASTCRERRRGFQPKALPGLAGQFGSASATKSASVIPDARFASACFGGWYRRYRWYCRASGAGGGGTGQGTAGYQLALAERSGPPGTLLGTAFSEHFPFEYQLYRLYPLQEGSAPATELECRPDPQICRQIRAHATMVRRQGQDTNRGHSSPHRLRPLSPTLLLPWRCQPARVRTRLPWWPQPRRRSSRRHRRSPSRSRLTLAHSL